MRKEVNFFLNDWDEKPLLIVCWHPQGYWVVVQGFVIDDMSVDVATSFAELLLEASKEAARLNAELTPLAPK
jgi:hypothetical protein